ncbi:crossveinless d [Carabus blaptoides fortunei]
MGRLTFIVVLTLLCLQWSDASIPVPSGKEYVYSYAGSVQTLNTEYNDLAARWNISAKLVLQSNGADIAMKFEDIKTSLTNGYQADIDSSKVLPIPEEAHQLYLPFVVHYYNNGSASGLSHQPDEPLWSLNMKRAIASIIQINTDNIEQLHEEIYFEQNIYGNCEVEYLLGETDKTISKNIFHNLCADTLDSSWSNLAPASVIPEGFNPITTTTVRTYQFAQKDDVLLLKTIDSYSNITYQTMHCEKSSLQVVQIQGFELLSESAVSKPIDVTKNTESVSLIYFYDAEDKTSGRQPKKTVDPEELLNNLKGYYKDFKSDFHKYPLFPGDLGVNNSIIDMFIALSEMDADTMVDTHLEVLFTNDDEVRSVFLSLLPYIGTNVTVDLIQSSLEADALNDLIAIKIMATFPKYVNVYTVDLLKKMEGLMNLKQAENKHVKYAGILSFAAMVAEANVRADIPIETLEKYYRKYETHLRDAEDYEEKMTYLLGLINMGNLLDADIMVSLITDTEQSHHIRSLAAYGFKPYLSLSSQQIFNELWPIVKNHDEHFEVRVAVLDLLMSLALTSEEFNMIIEEFNKESEDKVEQHLQNYLSTTLESLQNTTMYHDNLGALATKSAEVVDIPSYYDAWATGNYRIAYTDAAPNFGSSFQARLVANPITNLVNVVQLSYNQFAFSMNLGTYTAYIKLDGIADILFVGSYLSDRPNDEIAIPQLVELIKKFNYKIVDDLDIHIEVVLFSDDRAVFGMHINKDNLEKYTENPLFGDLLKLLVEYEYVTFPKLNTKTLRTDLGTLVEAFHVDTNVVSHKLKTDLDQLTDDSEMKLAELNYRSSRFDIIALETYNPVMDVNINVYKFKSNAQRIHLPIAVNVTGEYFTFDNINDTINVMLDRIIGTTVDGPEKLAEFGSSEAEVQVPMEYHREKMLKLEDFGIELNATVSGNSPAPRTSFTQLIDSFRSNSLAIPLAEPLLFYWYTLDYYRYLEREIESISIRTKAFYEEPTENVWEWNFDVDDVYDENDPINGTELSVFSKISCRRKHDAKILSSIGANYSYTDAPVSHAKSGTTHVEQKHKFRAEYSDDDTHYIACFDREIQYPSRRADKWSISPVEPAKSKGRFSAGTTDDSKACSNDFSIIFTDIFEPSEHLMKTVKNMKEYKTCKTDSAGLKYTPPTDACFAVHRAVSKYSNYTMYLDLKNAGWLSKYDKMFRTSDRGMKFLQMYYVKDDVAHFTMSKDLLDALNIDDSLTENIVDRDISSGLFSSVEDPTMVAYDDYDALIGLSVTCDITSSVISSFTSKEIKNYESKDDKEIVAYVECIDETRGGMTIQKFADKKIGFTMWSGNDTLITSMAGDKLKIVLNGEELHKQYSSDQYFKVYFLEDDVLYITNQLVEVYYNTEYISIKTPSLYNNYICGLCAHENKFNTDNQVS